MMRLQRDLPGGLGWDARKDLGTSGAPGKHHCRQLLQGSLLQQLHWRMEVGGVGSLLDLQCLQDTEW